MPGSLVSLSERGQPQPPAPAPALPRGERANLARSSPLPSFQTPRACLPARVPVPPLSSLPNRPTLCYAPTPRPRRPQTPRRLRLLHLLRRKIGFLRRFPPSVPGESTCVASSFGLIPHRYWLPRPFRRRAVGRQGRGPRIRQPDLRRPQHYIGPPPLAAGRSTDPTPPDPFPLFLQICCRASREADLLPYRSSKVRATNSIPLLVSLVGLGLL